MSLRRRWLVFALGVVALAVPQLSLGQADPQGYLFNAGQTIQPFFEGWSRNADGGFEMHFGYLNRNYVEELHVPIGADNQVTPDGPDRGQPTFFYPREYHRVFSVTVPADWGDREVVWQVTTRDQTYRAVGWLQAEWEIAASGGGFFGPVEGNLPPTLTIEAATTVNLPDPLTMTAAVSDDGLPEPRERRGGGAETLPTFEPTGPTLPINVPQIQPESRSRPIRARAGRITVTWTQLRGPTGVKMATVGEPTDDGATVTASFASPGEYLFQVEASDGPAAVTETVAVTVQ